MRRRFVQIDGELIEVDQDYREVLPADVAHGVVADIQPYQSMVDGSMITSRREHREHLKRHNVIEIGNEKLTAKPTGLPPEYYDRRKQVIAAMVDKYGEDRLRRDARRLGEELRWNSRGK